MRAIQRPRRKSRQFSIRFAREEVDLLETFRARFQRLVRRRDPRVSLTATDAFALSLDVAERATRGDLSVLRRDELIDRMITSSHEFADELMREMSVRVAEFLKAEHGLTLNIVQHVPRPPRERMEAFLSALERNADPLIAEAAAIAREESR